MVSVRFSLNDSKHRIKPNRTMPRMTVEVRRSIVEVYFAERNMTLPYYNDMFDLHRGDMVYVEGKLEGLLGRVISVNYNFKIKLSDYKRVIGVADTKARGQLYIAPRDFVTFDRSTVPKEKVRSWLMPPAKPDDVYVSGSDGRSFLLAGMEGFNVAPVIADRGEQYYAGGSVKYATHTSGQCCKEL